MTQLPAWRLSGLFQTAPVHHYILASYKLNIYFIWFYIFFQPEIKHRLYRVDKQSEQKEEVLQRLNKSVWTNWTDLTVSDVCSVHWNSHLEIHVCYVVLVRLKTKFICYYPVSGD